MKRENMKNTKYTYAFIVLFWYFISDIFKLDKDTYHILLLIISVWTIIDAIYEAKEDN